MNNNWMNNERLCIVLTDLERKPNFNEILEIISNLSFCRSINKSESGPLNELLLIFKDGSISIVNISSMESNKEEFSIVLSEKELNANIINGSKACDELYLIFAPNPKVGFSPNIVSFIENIKLERTLKYLFIGVVDSNFEF
jgi:hypothetical protein